MTANTATTAKTATLVRKNLPGFNGTAHLYRAEPPMPVADWDGDTVGEAPYVIVSATIVPFGSGPETYIFPGDEDGNVTDWGELDGSYRGGLDHEAALEGAGYTVVQG